MRNVGKRSSWVALATAVSLGLLGSCNALAEKNSQSAALIVAVFDYSDVVPTVLSSAEREASRIFGQTGIRLQWTYCSTGRSPVSTSICEGEPAPGQIRLRVLRRHLNYDFKESVFGFAIAPSLASVYYESAERLVQSATDSSSNTPIILGCLMAHEIGHLLLGHDQHTVSGIMKATWDIEQIQQAMKGSLGFSPQQAEQMRDSIRRGSNHLRAAIVESTKLNEDK